MHVIESPAHLTSAVESLMLSAADKFELNRALANRTRQFFRQQIRSQRDINNEAYTPRTTKKQQSNRENRGDMFTGLSRSLKTRVSGDGFEVGLAGQAGRIASLHNEGATVEFTTRVNGFFDSNTGRWTGTPKKNYYSLPKRTMIGWTPVLERELLAIIGDAMNNRVE